MPLPVTPTTRSQQQLAGLIGVFVEDDPSGDPNVFHPIGACITSATLPALTRASNTATNCINLTDCSLVATQWVTSTAYLIGDRVSNGGFIYEASTNGTSGGTPPTHEVGTVSDGGVDWDFVDAESSGSSAANSGLPFTSPGTRNESTFQFTTNHVAGSEQTRWFECEANTNSPGYYRWMLCHPNGVQQIMRSAWVRDYTPDAISADIPFQTATVVISLADDWHYIGGDTGTELNCDGSTP